MSIAFLRTLKVWLLPSHPTTNQPSVGREMEQTASHCQYLAIMPGHGASWLGDRNSGSHLYFSSLMEICVLSIKLLPWTIKVNVLLILAPVDKSTSYASWPSWFFTDITFVMSLSLQGARTLVRDSNFRGPRVNVSTYTVSLPNTLEW